MKTFLTALRLQGFAFLGSLLAACGGLHAADGRARAILDLAGVKGGLVVHLGCGDGTLTAALRATDSYLVHGLARDPATVARARQQTRELGLSGVVSVDAFDGKHLPYADDLVNLLVAEELGEVPMAEAMRVLAPRGVAMVGGKKTVKPWPGDIDEWSHYLHDGSNNAVAADQRVGPPRRLRWVAGPLWCRSHEFISSFAAMVSAGGRVFYVVDEGLTGVTDPRLPERWTLIARDAFNGVPLWRRLLPHWREAPWGSRSLRGRPASVPRRLVADGARLYATLSHQAGVSVLDAATGETLETLEGTGNAQELLLVGRTLVARLASGGDRREKGTAWVAAVDAGSGETRWRVRAARFVPQSLAGGGERVIYSDGKATICLGLADGRELWRAPLEGKRARGTTFVLHEDLVLEGGGWGIVARSARTGEVLWTAPGGGHAMRGEDLFVARGRAWHAAGGGLAGYDLPTGKVAQRVDPSDVQSPGHHLRCYRAKATERYVITQYRGAEFLSLTEAPHAQADWVRGPCRYGVLPANGLLYVPPDPCFCYPGAKVTGLLALAAGEHHQLPGPAAELERGPAYGQAEETESPEPELDAWPTYRHDPRRTGATTTEVPLDVARRWQVRLAGELTPPVVSRGRVYVAATDAHTLYAVGADDGRELWQFTAGGRIDSPPTVHGGRVLFGCGDGWVYCLRASDGRLAWRFRAAPSARRIVAFGRLASPWRVHGSVLVQDGLVYGTAGRSTFLDGGIRLFALEPRTGRLVHQARLDTWSRTREDAKGKPFIPAYHMEGAQSDLLVSQGGHIFLGQYKFDLALAPQPVPYVMPRPDGKTTAMDLSGKPYVVPNAQPNRDYETHQRRWLERTQKGLLAELEREYGGHNLGDRDIGLHVFSTASFLDDSWFNRTFWMYSATWPGYYIAHRGAKTGQLLVVGPQKTYAVQAYPSRNLQSPLFTPSEKGYLLFADRNDNEPVLDPRTRGTTKGWGFTRAEPPVWHQWVPVRIRAMVLAGKHLFIAGPPDAVDPEDPMAAFEGRKGAVLRIHSATDGKTLRELALDAPPVFDGLIAAGGRLYLAGQTGRLTCLGEAP
ncbi:MAG: PQQ-binding-like beta-propeller repeat protein [bacterium]